MWFSNKVRKKYSFILYFFNIRKFDYITIFLNLENQIQINYGNGLSSKHKGKSPLIRHFKVGLDGDNCDGVISNNIV